MQKVNNYELLTGNLPNVTHHSDPLSNSRNVYQNSPLYVKYGANVKG